jgi:hypothetical protein
MSGHSIVRGPGRPGVGDPDYLSAEAAWAPTRTSGGREGGFEQFDDNDDDDDEDDFWRDTIGLLD